MRLARGFLEMPEAATSSHLGAEFHGAAETLVRVAERALASSDLACIPGGDLRQVITAAIKLYAAKAEDADAFSPPVLADKLTPTEVVLLVSELLRAADISLFDLAMWYRRGDRP